MNDEQKRTMLIHFNDGSKKLLEFSAPVADSDANLVARLNDALDASQLIVEAGGALMVIPVGSIKYFECFPAPKKLPAYAIKDVSFKD